MTLKYTYLLIIAALLVPFTLHAQIYENHQKISAVVKNLIEASMSDISDKDISIQTLDSRLLLPKCNQPLVTFLPIGSKLSGKTTIGVRCTGEKPWKIYVSATISIYAEVIIANKYITRGTTITADHISSTKKEISLISRGYYSKYDQVVGKVAKYNLQKNRIIHGTSITRPKLVKRGMDVDIIAYSGGITVKMRGIAMADGAMGDHVKIKNIRSHRVIQAEVIDNNLVRVKM